jgi:riboflavin biosynthesis pyrimidine reductase
VQRLLPGPATDLDLADAYPVTDGRDGAFVRVNMISSLDGAISVDGRSGALGGAADRQVFNALRAAADVVVVGAGTMRAEQYGPARVDEAAVQQRLARGQHAQPPIAVVSRAAQFDFSSPFFTDAQIAPLLVTSAARAGSLAREAGSRADVIAAGAEGVEPARLVEELADRGFRSQLVEGGPGLNGDLARAGVIDELCLTVSPLIVSGDGPRIFAGPPLMPPVEPRVIHVLEEGGFLFARMNVRR